jgi:AraC family ethanolamine operon transcriptional activator
MTDLIASGVIDSFDLDEHADASAPWQVSFDQLSKGPFRAQIEFVLSGDLMLYREHWNRRLHVTGASPEGYVMIRFPASPQSQVVWDGDLLGPGYVALKNPGTEVDFSTAETSDHLVLLVPPERLASYVGDEVAAKLATIRHGIQVAPRITVSLARAIVSLIEQYSGRDAAVDSPARCASIESELLNIVAQNFETDVTDPDLARRPKRKKALCRAIDYLDDQGCSVPIPELSVAAGVSQRTLEYAFRETYGVSPNAFVRLSRMNRLRRRLLNSAPESTSITEAASALDFSELGRLAVEYRQLFGESPSATLARRRTSAAVHLTDNLTAA